MSVPKSDLAGLDFTQGELQPVSDMLNTPIPLKLHWGLPEMVNKAKIPIKKLFPATQQPETSHFFTSP